MTTATGTKTMRDLLAMPDDNKRRWIIGGELHQEDMTRRNRFHSIVMANLSGELYIWRSRQASPRGNVVCGEAAVQLSDDKSTGFGIDVAYVPAEVMLKQGRDHTMILGVPSLVPRSFRRVPSTRSLTKRSISICLRASRSYWRSIHTIAP